MPSCTMMLLVTIGFLPFVAAQLPGNACDDLCSLIPGCTFKGSYCKDYKSPPHVCQDLYFIKTADSANATPCSVAFQKNCHEYYPVRCDDVLPFDRKGPRFPIKASAKLEPQGSGSQVRGTFYFEQESHAKTKISYDVYNLEPFAQHGVHVHEFSDFSNGCTSTGGHYNPFYKFHGDRLNMTVRHVGDMGNIKADASGRAKGSFYDSLILLFGPTSSLTRSVVLHADQDDLGLGGNPGSRATGNSGARLVCGKIASD
ncbi:Superoxide dismutase [Cu-Zn] [Perkinsus olseni]|uniref:Superoxide dismutase [Cu-Zn] n=1 Tax=Perkinsus olseni TaxID=32597 RepID=A0A7J6P353_PEROL|nr:Superoxide dismutase [Cu-Zn] [Perkinsus olseni]